MECMFPGLSTAHRRFGINTVELKPGAAGIVSGMMVSAWEGDHPSGAPALILRLDLAGKTVAYTGDTAWTNTLIDAATDVDRLIAEAYYRDKNIPCHLRLADLDAHRDRLTAKRIIVIHMSADVLEHQDEVSFAPAYDGLVINL